MSVLSPEKLLILQESCWQGSHQDSVNGISCSWSGRVSSRASSARTWTSQESQLLQSIAKVEGYYANFGGRPAFWFQDSCPRWELDAVLEQLGYGKVHQAGVLKRPVCKEAPVDQCWSVGLEDWLSQGALVYGWSAIEKKEYGDILRSNHTCSDFLLMVSAGTPVACACGVEKDGALGIFLLAVHEDHQGMGWGRKMMQSLHYQAFSRGLPWSWLQVENKNIKAKSLYSSLGYEDCTSFYFRIKGDPADK